MIFACRLLKISYYSRYRHSQQQEKCIFEYIIVVMFTPENEIQTDYKVRINRVFDYIGKNLDADLSLAVLADIACFSAFHFHRIFKVISGETVGEYVTRRRIEKSAAELIHRNVAIRDLCFKYGFSEQASYTRTFKKFYGLSPTAFRKQNSKKFSKISQVLSKNGQTYPDDEKYLCVIDHLKKWIDMNANIKIREIKKLHLACVPAVGHKNIPAAYQKLLHWARPAGLLNANTTMITVYHDSFKVTEPEKIRMDACMLLEEPTGFDAEVGPSTIESGKYIVGSFEIRLDEFEKSWTGLFIWMNENGYKKSDNNPFELYHNNFNDHPEKKAIVDFHIPIE